MKYVALLRGINVGGNNKIAMAVLKASFESAGFTDVSTYINSGNVLFETKTADTEKIAAEIEALISSQFLLEIPVVVRTAESIQTIMKKIPDDWQNNKEQKTDVIFLWEEFARKKTLRLIDTNPKVDTLLYVDGAIVWHLEKKDYSKSGMNDFVVTKIYKHMTARNVNTVRKLAELLQD